MLLDMHAAPCGHNAWNIDYGYPFLYDDRDLSLADRRGLAANGAPLRAKSARSSATISSASPRRRRGKRGQARLDDTYKKIAAAIREVDRNHLLFLTSVRTGRALRRIRKMNN